MVISGRRIAHFGLLAVGSYKTEKCSFRLVGKITHIANKDQTSVSSRIDRFVAVQIALIRIYRPNHITRFRIHFLQQKVVVDGVVMRRDIWTTFNFFSFSVFKWHTVKIDFGSSESVGAKSVENNIVPIRCLNDGNGSVAGFGFSINSVMPLILEICCIGNSYGCQHHERYE